MKTHVKTKTHSTGGDSSLLFKDGTDQEYALVVRMLGDNRCMVNAGGVERMGVICGRLRKRRNAYISVNDMVLVSRRDYQDDKVDIIHVYSQSDVKLLIKYDELPREAEEMDDNSNYVVFEHI
jgi:translation initiation factor 1A